MVENARQRDLDLQEEFGPAGRHLTRGGRERCGAGAPQPQSCGQTCEVLRKINGSVADIAVANGEHIVATVLRGTLMTCWFQQVTTGVGVAAVASQCQRTAESSLGTPG
ncbi:hypothetical protein [Streptomyces sp. BK340]|uniref:hypothetical protein n=1 Tax=Streptomyces sp. BK340 TaxID=2572903 RepID=UPI0011A4A88B|nr:hypothetical protein [Streptomyces sp. BK340]